MKILSGGIAFLVMKVSSATLDARSNYLARRFDGWSSVAHERQLIRHESSGGN